MFVLDETPGRGKFDEKSQEERFVGYSTRVKAYRIKLKGSRKIIATRDVVFDKKCLPKGNEDASVKWNCDVTCTSPRQQTRAYPSPIPKPQMRQKEETEGVDSDLEQG